MLNCKIAGSQLRSENTILSLGKGKVLPLNSTMRGCGKTCLIIEWPSFCLWVLSVCVHVRVYWPCSWGLMDSYHIDGNCFPAYLGSLPMRFIEKVGGHFWLWTSGMFLTPSDILSTIKTHLSSIKQQVGNSSQNWQSQGEINKLIVPSWHVVLCFAS